MWLSSLVPVMLVVMTVVRTMVMTQNINRPKVRF
jgi:hypothetical protein